MTCVIQGILPSQYFPSVNLCNYGFPYVPKSVTPQCAFTCNYVQSFWVLLM
jgi:hypothetical protein